MITIFINNDDVNDLFVTVTDFLTSTPTVVMTSQRINANSSPVGIQVQVDGSGKGDIEWTATQATDSTKTKTSPHLQPAVSETVDVDVFGV